MPKGNPAIARLHRDWLSRLPTQTGKSLTALAKEIKVGVSTLTRPLSEGDDGTSTLHANTIAKVVQHTGVAPPAELAGPLATGRRSASGFGEEATPYQAEPGDAVDTALRALGAITGGSVVPWTLHTRALELAGFMPGDVVLVDLNNLTPLPGEAVCAQVYDWPRMKSETVMRIYERAGPVNLLVTKTADAGTMAQPLVVDGERVAVKGTLLPHRLRPAHQRPPASEPATS